MEHTYDYNLERIKWEEEQQAREELREWEEAFDEEMAILMDDPDYQKWLDEIMFEIYPQ